MDNKEKFDKMLATDREVFIHLSQWKTLLGEMNNKISQYKLGDFSLFTESEFEAYYGAFNSNFAAYNQELNSYLARQDDYRTNTAYKISQSLNEFNDSAIKWFGDLWSKIKLNNDMGVLPALVIPVSIIAGSTIAIVAIAYFVGKYYTETANSLPRIAKAVQDMKDVNPQMAAALIEKATELNTVAIKENANSGLTNQIGSGIKAVLIGGTAIAILISGYKVLKDNKII